MRFKSSKPFILLSILIFLFCIYNLFPQSARIELIKIYKQRDADIEILYSPQIKIVQELKTCFIAHVDSGFSSNLRLSGFRFECLDDDIKNKKYYLVHCSLPAEISTLKYYGNVRPIEEDLALFWSEKKEIGQILPAHFKIDLLPQKPLHPFEQSSLAPVESFHPEIKFPLKFKINNIFPQSTKIELIKIYKQRDVDIEILYSPQIKIVQELRTCFIAHVDSGFSSNLLQAGIKFEYLDDDIKDKKYFLVYCPPPLKISTLESYGNVRPVEENIALFWSDKKEAREVLPAHFQINRLPSKPLHSFKQRTLALFERFRPEIDLSLKFEIDPVISNLVNQVSKANLTNYIQNLQDFQTRYASTTNCELAGDYIYDFFIQSGIEAEYDPFSFELNYSSNNIVGTHEGEVDPSQIVVICAHYDSTSDQPYTLAPGADDNASGCSAVMEASRIFANQSFDFTVKFICFSAEEWGLYGSRDYAEEARENGEDIIAVINLDMIAYTFSLPEDLDIICNIPSIWLGNKLSSTTIAYTLIEPYLVVNASIIWSDHSPFWNNGYSAILGIEDFTVPNPYYHSTFDTIDTLNLDFLTEVVKASLAAVADLAQPVSTPRTPTGLTSRSQIVSSLFSSIKTVYLNWDSNQDQVIGYNVYRTTASRSNYLKLNDSPLIQTYYEDNNLDANSRYYYVVTAVDNQSNESNYSKQVVDDENNESTNPVIKRTSSRDRINTLIDIRKFNNWK